MSISVNGGRHSTGEARPRGRWPRRVGSGLAALVLLGTGLVAAPAPAAASGTLPGHVRPAHPDAAALTAALDALTAAGMPGSYAEARDGQAVWRGASGVADVSTADPARPWLRHRIGSVTKTFVATTVLQLVAERRVGLDDPVAGLLPRFGLDRRITIRMLLNHTSGIGNYTNELDSFEKVEQWQTRTFTPDELVRMGLAQPGTGVPGQRWSYSNTNYILAGLVIERVTGHDASREITRRIIRRLGLHDTWFPGLDPIIRGPHAAAYLPWPDAAHLRDFSVYNMSWAWTAGEVISTMDDLNTFYRALARGRLLPPAQWRQMRQTVPMDPQVPQAGGYGLGIYVLNTGCGQFWGHDGGVIGQTTQVLESVDGRRQISWGGNYSYYFAEPYDGPIGSALGEFLYVAICGAGGGATSGRATSGGAAPDGAAEAGPVAWAPLGPVPTAAPVR